MPSIKIWRHMYLIFTITEIPKPHSSRVFTALSLVNVFVTHKGQAKFSYELGADFTPQKLFTNINSLQWPTAVANDHS